MMQCKLHQTSWIDQDFSGGECSECTKERRDRIQHINKLTAKNRELMEQWTAALVENIELRAELDILKARFNDKLEDCEDANP